jgi:hypothetical protein
MYIGNFMYMTLCIFNCYVHVFCSSCLTYCSPVHGLCNVFLEHVGLSSLIDLQQNIILKKEYVL